MRTRVTAALVVGALAVLVSGAIALGDKEAPVAPADFDRAAKAAVAAAGGGQATSVDRDTENGATWEVEVTKADGSRVDVLLDVEFRVINVSGEREPNEAAAAQPKPDDDAEKPVPSADAARAAEAAVKAAGGGTAGQVDFDAENGATWEVEVTKSDGTQVDVLLDAEFRVLHVGAEQDSGEPADDSSPDDDSDDD
jgi:uncharacterized membrane protein YkoI